ncbi:sensor histidine kinase [Fodinicurvata fenggangensis]|uniref:sensor histidine kinase n=1 Tax=Fodinicurvata fenggangensis TaxID=1121830 RepID=UPI000478E419|nr:sensor histidine kinase [Fodinicurvata fenggangensis]
MQGYGIILLVAVGYLSLLFAVAYFADKRAEQGRSLLNPYIYTLSIAVFCTSWTFYGSVGQAATTGFSFLPTYLGPTLVFTLWWVLLRKMVRIGKAERITSIADFISSRYGKSTVTSGAVTVIAVVAILPYIALQLKAVYGSFIVMLQGARNAELQMPLDGLAFIDNALLITLLMAGFAILFGTRHIDASEHHEGMVTAVAFESVVKLVAFLAVGIFVTFGLFNGFGDLFSQAQAVPEIASVLSLDAMGTPFQWITLMLLSMAAIICLPRQFQVMVVENVDERHLKKAVWLFPLYLLAINLFVMPIALAGLLMFPDGGVNPDTFVLAVPLAEGQTLLAFLAFVGGLSAATAMIIVETVALSTMICNDLVMPVLLRWRALRLNERGDLTRLLLGIRRGSILLILLLSYLYVRNLGGSYTLVTIGLISFAAAAQFAPAIVGGLFWKGGTRNGALTGLLLGFFLWSYTLLLPSFARSGWLPLEFIEAGPFGIELLKPYALFGLTGLDELTHSLIWSMLGNILGYVVVSAYDRPGALERIQAVRFVDVFAGPGGEVTWRGTATQGDLQDLLGRFLGPAQAQRVLSEPGSRKPGVPSANADADPAMLARAERALAGVIGGASARVMVGSIMKGERVGFDEVMQILDETSHVISYSRQLEQKSRELQELTAELRAANERLKELDRLKDDFLATVSHELRTPLTAIRSFGELLADNPDTDAEQRARFLDIIVKESERLTRLINQILDLARMEAGRMDWEMSEVEPRTVVMDALAATAGLFDEREVTLEVEVPEGLPLLRVDRDRLMQVIVNLLSNAVKFCRSPDGEVSVQAALQGDSVVVSIRDNGPGITPEDHERIFERFQQAGSTLSDKPKGTGLGLPISRQIIESFGGRIWVESTPGAGACFRFSLPTSESEDARQDSAAE